VLIALPGRDGELVIRAAAGEHADELRGLALARSASKLGRVLERSHSERIDSLIDDLEVDQELGRRLQLRTGLFVPLRSRDRAIGVIALHDKEGDDARFSDEDVRLAEIFAPRVATAVELSESVARDALRRVVAAQELERKRLARELHDETGQALTSILLGLKAVEGAEEGTHREAAAQVREQVKATLQDVRRLAVELRPSALDDFGLVPALQRLVDTFTEQTGIAVHLEAHLGEERLPAEIETTLYRIVQEALTNVVKHAQARTVSVVLRRRNGTVSAVFEDDGRGFTVGDTGGLGIVGMRERADLVNGRFSLESRPGAGTTLSLEVPLP
jgi:two-component system, NarL family, sensor histidine kinase DevS